MRRHRHRSAGYYIPKIIDETLGTKFEIVSGYPSGQDIDFAVERGELQCRAFTITAYFAREPFISWRKRNFTSVIDTDRQQTRCTNQGLADHLELMDKYKTNDNGRRLWPKSSWPRETSVVRSSPHPACRRNA